MRDLTDGLGFWVIICGLMAVLAFLIICAIEEDKKWQKFKEDNQCKVVAHINGDVFNTYGIDSKGQMTVGIGSTSDKTGYLCNDGITYYR